jgi:hypothetical protein
MADRDLRIRNDKDRITEYPAAAAQTLKVGQPVALDGDGRVVLATAGSAALLGICAKDATSTSAGDPVFVHDHPDVEFEIAADDPTEVLQTVVGETHDLIVDSGTFKVNLGATATNVLRIKAIKSFYDPNADGSAYEGSALAGDFTPGWRDGAQVLCEIALHVLKA